MKTIRSLQLSFAMRIALVGLVILLMAVMSGAKQSGDDDESLHCERCHTCDVPTAHQPCLVSCPRVQMVNQTTSHDLAEAPDTIVLDILADLYQPVYFAHELHATMAEMGDSCAICHHYSPPGHIPPCRECHDPESQSGDLAKPNLKGAYHRQCLSCHREWSHDSKCVVCHEPAKDEILATAPPDPTDIIGHSHPVIAVPVTKVYTTTYEEGPVVTFQHNEHIELFGFRCVDCHQQESCSNCHDIEEQNKETRTPEELHDACYECHADDACSKCHDTKERPGFTHHSTGWPLGTYHEGLDCRSCHPADEQIARPDPACANCHDDWNQENFHHEITGLELDEIHVELDCVDCHYELRFDQEPVCSDCHDDDRTAKTALPGSYRHTN